VAIKRFPKLPLALLTFEESGVTVFCEMDCSCCLSWAWFLFMTLLSPFKFVFGAAMALAVSSKVSSQQRTAVLC
jgi:hypothetical protein